MSDNFGDASARSQGTPKRRRPAWVEAARQRYLDDESASYAAIAEEFGVTTRTVESWGSREHWPEARRSHVENAQVISRAMAVADKADELLKHAATGDQIAAIARELLDQIIEVEADAKKTLRNLGIRAEVLNTISTAATSGVKLARLARGIQPGESSAPEEDDRQIEVVQRRIAPLGLVVDESGRVVLDENGQPKTFVQPAELRALPGGKQT